MLPFKNRLKLPVSWSRSNPDLQLRTDLFKVLVKRTAESSPKVGFIISSKVGKANIRNKIRRSLSKIVYQELPRLQSNQEIIFIVFPECAKATNENLSDSFYKILPKISN